MSKKGFKSAIRSLGRAFRAKDEAGFDEALGELEESVEDMKDGGEEDPDTIEVHNHIPDSHMRDTAHGELPTREGSGPAFDNEEAPPWFKKHEEATDKKFKAMTDSIEALKGDRRNSDEFPLSEEEEEEEEERRGESDPNLEMDRGRRNNDEPSEREEMAERIRENGGNKDRRDEANKEILGELEFEAPPGTGDKARKARDSRYLEDSFQDVVSKAEILAPGINLPTFDRAAPPTKTFRAIDKLRRTTLDLAYHKSETRGIIDAAMSGRTFDAKRARTSDARTIFNVLATTVAQGNNTRATDRRELNGTASHHVSGGLQSVADINKRNAEFYKGR